MNGLMSLPLTQKRLLPYDAASLASTGELKIPCETSPGNVVVLKSRSYGTPLPRSRCNSRCSSASLTGLFATNAAPRRLASAVAQGDP